jgi:hypothetical protein
LSIVHREKKTATSKKSKKEEGGRREELGRSEVFHKE